PAERPAAPAEAEPAPVVVEPGPDAVTAEPPGRHLLRPVLLDERADAGTDPSSVLTGTRWILLGDAPEVAARLASHGAEVSARARDHVLTETDGPVDGVLWSGALAGTDEMPLLPASFPVLKAALARAPRWLLAVRPADGEVPDPRTAGLRGLFRTVAREYLQMVARIIEVSDSSPSALADAVVAEAVASDRTPVVLRTAAGRHGFELVAAPLGVLGSTGAGPAGAGTPEATALGLDQDSVVLLAGGARGITAQFAAVLAGAARCRLELLGRTPAPDGP
ncbi:polyketide synthase, partial [Streptomyces sp. Wh19]|nr:polyketide synthase [Streptomyces sp. Wh19]